MSDGSPTSGVDDGDGCRQSWHVQDGFASRSTPWEQHGKAGTRCSHGFTDVAGLTLAMEPRAPGVAWRETQKSFFIAKLPPILSVDHSRGGGRPHLSGAES